MKNKGTPTPSDLSTLKTSTLNLVLDEAPQSKGAVREKNAARHGPLSTSSCGSFIHVVKSSTGSGLLAMPDAFHNIGLVGGLVGATLVTVICSHCLHIIVKSSQELCYRRARSHMSFTDTVESAFLLGAGGRLKHWSKFMRHTASCFMFVTYYGVNTAYVILIASTAKQVVESHVAWSMNIRWYILLLTLILLPVGIVRHLKFMVSFSAIANVLQITGCSLAIYLCFLDMPSPSSRPMIIQDITRWPLFLATSIFGMEGIGTIIPIENVMRKPAQFLGCPGVLNLSMFVVGCLYILVGCVGYMRFGEDVQGSFTLNLSQDWLSEVVKVLIAVAVLFTYPLQLTASVGVVWGGVSQYFSDSHQDAGYYFVRAFLILGTLALGAAVPTLGPVISLFGAIGFSGLGVLVPSLTELVTFWKPSALQIAKHGVLLTVYLICTVAGTIASIQCIIKEYHLH